MDCTHAHRQILFSGRGLFESLRTDAARMAVAAGPVVEHLEVIEDIHRDHISGFYIRFLFRSFFKRTEKGFGYRIILKLQRQLILGARLLAPQKRCQPSLIYWQP